MKRKQVALGPSQDHKQGGGLEAPFLKSYLLCREILFLSSLAHGHEKAVCRYVIGWTRDKNDPSALQHEYTPELGMYDGMEMYAPFVAIFLVFVVNE